MADRMVVLGANPGTVRTIAVTKPRRHAGTIVVPTVVGSRYVAAGPDERKRMWRDQLLTLHPFKEVSDLVRRLGEVERTLILQMIVLRMPNENYEQMLKHHRMGTLRRSVRVR